MSLITSRSPSLTRSCFRNRSIKCGVTQSLSNSSVLGARPSNDEPGSEQADRLVPLLQAQTHTGIRNTAHGLHILRSIEKKYGPVESYLFPREPGSGDHLPSFFFKFRNIESFRKLAKPFAHLDIPEFPLEQKPNHSIGLADIQDLISQTPSNGVGPSTKDAPRLSRYAVRIEVSQKPAYPQPRLSPEANYAQKTERIQRALASLKPGANPIRPTSDGLSPEAKNTESLDGLLKDTFNVPENTVVLPRKPNRPSSRRGNSTASRPREDEELGEFRLFRARQRNSWSQAPSGLPEALASTSPISGVESPIGATPSEQSTPQPIASLPSTPLSGTKRARLLEQTRRAAATAQIQAREAAEKKAAEEAAAQKAATDEPPAPQNTSSIWTRLLGR
ncbi:hypothetical protein BDV93DRAFT_517481 [Ceratobasidium sp. AG-I]|nr:hypothetical protein BDV93DRAFT_517481 [Ceratobasidium sp. AG-I]